MKKLFFFRSSSGNKNNNAIAPPAMDKQIYWESVSDRCLDNSAGDKDESNFHTPKDLILKSRQHLQDITGPGLRRSRSLSSTAFFDDELGGKNVPSKSSSSSFSSGPYQQRDHSSRALTPEKHRRQKGSQFLQTNKAIERSRDISLENSSLCCSNTSNNVLDLYIDGEHQQEKSRSQRNNNIGDRIVNERLPPRVHNITSTDSQTDSVEDNKPKAHSFRERRRFLSGDWAENGFGHESPRRLAKNVVERLSKTRAFPKSKSKEFDRGVPITIEDIYGESLNTEFIPQKKYSMDETDEKIDLELKRRSKEAEEKFILFSKELEQENFLHDCRFDMPSLIQTVRHLMRSLGDFSLYSCVVLDRAPAKSHVASICLLIMRAASYGIFFKRFTELSYRMQPFTNMIQSIKLSLAKPFIS